MKKYIALLTTQVISFMSFAHGIWNELSTKFQYWDELNNPKQDVWQVIKPLITDEWGFFFRMIKIFYWWNVASKWAWFAYIQQLLNYILWLLWFIAVVILIYQFYRIFFDKEEEWIKAAQKAVKNVFIALAFIWLSRFIITFIFYVLSRFK